MKTPGLGRLRVQERKDDERAGLYRADLGQGKKKAASRPIGHERTQKIENEFFLSSLRSFVADKSIHWQWLQHGSVFSTNRRSPSADTHALVSDCLNLRSQIEIDIEAQFWNAVATGFVSYRDRQPQ
ncbi:MAG: hypothetical protein KJ060_02510, partial [Candidatus Hydrogenedentes bacterium]|nr:hypothetical protein [Candidatus Hydrogenedentota bacterium]